METIIIATCITLLAAVIIMVALGIKAILEEEVAEREAMFNLVSPVNGQINSQAKCFTCGAYIDEINKVETTFGTRYYCNTHKKPYTVVRGGFYDDKVTYYGTVEMFEDGTPVGYKKIK